MKILLTLIALAGLILTVIPSFLVFMGKLSWNAHSQLMLVGMICWFVSAPVLLKNSANASENNQ